MYEKINFNDFRGQYLDDLENYSSEEEATIVVRYIADRRFDL